MKMTGNRVSVAPMMDWTDRHCRYFHRLLAPKVRLYTEMVTTGALLFGNTDRFLQFEDAEHPVALQLGGADPDDLARCARLAADRGYDEVNLNCGCPSDRVQRGRFGACLMAEPGLVGDCLAAMREAVDIPVTVKSRIGIDNHDDYGFLRDFVGTVSARSGIDTVILHARKAWLSGLSPRENREVPPLDYDRVARLKADFPDLRVVLNGGLRTKQAIETELSRFDGVMIGREAYQNPWLLRELYEDLEGAGGLLSRDGVVDAMVHYAKARAVEGVPVKSITRHMLGLFQGMPGARKWRRHLSENAVTANAGPEVLYRAREAMAPHQRAAA